MINVFELTRSLVDIESITNNEGQLASCLEKHLCDLAFRFAGRVERMEVERDRFNVFACWGEPVVTLSSHIDTVPPFIPSREDDEHIWGRGACDAKGIVAAMVAASERLLTRGTRNFGLLLVVGEERNSAGAIVAGKSPRGSRFLINGEPTENKLALGSKGALRLELRSAGRAAHSAFPELGESAIEKLLDALEAVRRVPLPQDSLLGACTLNIGTISGGQAPNVVADFAQAEILVRLVDDSAPIRQAITDAAGCRAEVKEVLCLPAMRYEPFDGLPTTIASFTSDIPFLSPAWGKPFLIGPGSIHLAHGAEERVPKKELLDAVNIYSDIVSRLLCAA